MKRLSVYFLLVCMYVCMYMPTAYSQVVFSGPAEGKVNRMNSITVTEVKGKDCKLCVHFNGSPADPSDYLILKNDDGQRVVMILTDKQGVFTVVGGTNDGTKTFLSHHKMTVGTPSPPGPTPPNPTPIPPGSNLESKIRAVYNPGVDAAVLPKLIAIFDEVASKSYKNYDEMETVLQATAKKFLTDSDLRKVRDVIGDYIVSKAGTDPRRYDVDKVKVIYTEITTVLKKIQTGA
jgi:hypothetical protein